jgi:biopolymer transport protein ExbD
VLQADEFDLGVVGGGNNVMVPRGMNHVSISQVAFRRSVMMVSLPKEGEVYWDRWRTANQALIDNIRQAAAGKPEPDRIVYVKASFALRHQEIVDLFKLVRRAGLNRVRLVVHQQSISSDGAGKVGWFEVRLEPEANPADLSELKPDPLSLVAGIGSGGKLTLNATYMGTIEDSSLLTSRLTQVFAERAQAGTAERTIVVRAADEIDYGEVARLVDCLTGVGAAPIVMGLDAPIPIGSKRQLASR